MGMRIENECCNCATESYPCLGSRCDRRKVKHFFCDECGAEESSEDLYVVEDGLDHKELCRECFIEYQDTNCTRVSDLEKEGYYD